jgi:hypothetical protein
MNMPVWPQAIRVSHPHILVVQLDTGPSKARRTLQEGAVNVPRAVLDHRKVLVLETVHDYIPHVSLRIGQQIHTTIMAADHVATHTITDV